MDDARRRLVRRVEDADREVWDDPLRGKIAFRTLFSGDVTPTSGLTTGVAELPPGGLLALHRHDPAETYHVLQGRGTVTLDGAEHDVAAGSSVFIPGGTAHAVRNTGTSPLRFFYALAADSMAAVAYRFHGAAGEGDGA